MKNIIVTGGGMVNKGAQALTLITVSRLRKQYPDHRIYLYNPGEFSDPNIRKDGYAFSFLGWHPMKFAQSQSSPLLHFLIKLRNGKELQEAEAIYRNTDFIVDISGYALGSNWSDNICNDFLDVLEFAQGFRIPVYLMPQSFGPFDFGPERKALDDRIRRLLPTAKVIYAREQEGYDALTARYGLTNVRLGTDLVLGSREIDLSQVFNAQPLVTVPQLPEGSVGIIPNSRNESAADSQTLLSLYDQVIRQLLSEGKTVYLLSHSSVDAPLCQRIKDRFAEESQVIYLDQDFSCLEFNALVKQFRFLIASRFHSIVHAYKNGIPCITLGWATKYHDLMAAFSQEQYMFDVRSAIEPAALLEALHQMGKNRDAESREILRGLESVQREDIFGSLPRL